MNEDTEVHETTAIATRAPSVAAGPGWALARLSDGEFESVMAMANKGRVRLLQVMRSMMKKGVHYDRLPGTDREVLLKPGGEVLAQMFRLVCEPLTEIKYGDGVVAPHFTVEAKCLVHTDSLDGPVVAVGQAAGNSWEKKWRYREGERHCPECGATAIIKGKKEYGGGYLCFKKKGGCGAKWGDGDPAIEGQATGLIENPDPYDLLNTVVKIVNKRAKQDGIINATNSSDLFTQDLDEGPRGGSETPRGSGADAAPRKPVAAPSPPKAADAEAEAGAPAIDPAVMRKFMAVARRAAFHRLIPAAVLEKTQEGHDARYRLLSGLLKMDIEHAGMITPGEWDFAIAELERSIAAVQPA
jgi:hypothetical protein